MAIVGILSWWYTAGWRLAATRVRARLISLFDYFSIDLLIRTLFSPFRQISAGAVDGPIGLKLRAFMDRLISRLIGAVVRTSVMLIGIVTILLTAISGVGYLVLWALLPLLPLVGFVFMLSGWVPWTIL